MGLGGGAPERTGAELPCRIDVVRQRPCTTLELPRNLRTYFLFLYIYIFFRFMWFKSLFSSSPSRASRPVRAPEARAAVVEYIDLSRPRLPPPRGHAYLSSINLRVVRAKNGAGGMRDPLRPSLLLSSFHSLPSHSPFSVLFPWRRLFLPSVHDFFRFSCRRQSADDWRLGSSVQFPMR